MNIPETKKNNYETQTCIYIENVNSNEIIFHGNIFKNNIGLLGGAININNKLYDY